MTTKYREPTVDGALAAADSAACSQADMECLAAEVRRLKLECEVLKCEAAVGRYRKAIGEFTPAEVRERVAKIIKGYDYKHDVMSALCDLHDWLDEQEKGGAK